MREDAASTEDRLYTLPFVLFAAIDAEAVSIDDIRAWADRQILQAQLPPPGWLIDLSLSTTRREAADAVLNETGKRFLLPDNISDLLLGLTYLRFRRSEITREELVVTVGEILDAYEASVAEMNVEGWYVQMAGKTNIPRTLQARLDDLADKAEEALSRLLNSQTAAEKEFWSNR
jgi:hypothetical protein